MTRTMRKILPALCSSERKWWRTLTAREKLYTVYFLASLTLAVGLADSSPTWAMFLALLNLGNSARMVKRVPTDKLEED